MEKIIRFVVLCVLVSLSTMSVCLAFVTDSGVDKGWQNEQEDNLEYISEGTRWESAYYVCDNPYDNLSVIEVKYNMWLEGTEDIHGLKYMKLWETFFFKDGPLTEFFGYIRTEGQKVYMLPVDSVETSGECLIYDCSLGYGESADVKSVEVGVKGFDDIESCVVTCNDIRKRSTCGKTFDLMEMGAVVTLNGRTMDISPWPALWIRGLGTTSGFLNNVLNGNDVGIYLRKIYHNETLIYDSTSGIDGIVSDEIDSSDGKKFHLDGTPFKDGDTGIYIQNGKKYFKSPNASE